MRIIRYNRKLARPASSSPSPLPLNDDSHATFDVLNLRDTKIRRFASAYGFNSLTNIPFSSLDSNAAFVYLERRRKSFKLKHFEESVLQVARCLRMCGMTMQEATTVMMQLSKAAAKVPFNWHYKWYRHPLWFIQDKWRDGQNSRAQDRR